MVAVIMFGLAALWLGLCVLAVASGGDPEAGLRAAFGRYSMADAFNYTNGVFYIFWAMHSFLTVTAVAARRRHRLDVLAVLLIGPGMALGICLFGERWSDPNWHNIIAICAIGWFVSVVVGAVYWRLRSTELGQPSHAPPP